MIDKTGMMQPLLQACPSFRPAWEEFLEEWAEEDEKPIYLALSDLARHLVQMLATDQEGLFRVFQVVELWHIEGDDFVREAATVGLLEDLQNENFHESTSPSDFKPFLLPESKRWWRRVEEFWESGLPLIEYPPSSDYREAWLKSRGKQRPKP